MCKKLAMTCGMDFLSPVVFVVFFPKFEIGKSWEDNGMTLRNLCE